MTKTLAIVANSTWNIQNFRLNVIDKFLEEGYQVNILAPVDEYIEYKENYPEVRHYNLRMLSRDSTNPLSDIGFTLELIRKLKRINPDLIIHYTNKPNIYGGFASRVMGTNSVAMVTGLGYAFIKNGWIRYILTKLYSFSSSAHKKFIFENIDDRLIFEKLKIVKQGQGVSIKGCGVDTNYFSPVPYKHEGYYVFTFIGRLLYDKGIKEFVHVAEKIRKEKDNVKFWVIGELDPKNPATVDKDELNRWIDQDIIEYYGFKRDVRPYIEKSSCVVLPSYREAIPRSITEAMSMSRPVITTDVPGCKEAVVDGENGFLVKVKDVDSLSSAVHKIINLTEKEIQIMGAKGRKMAEEQFDDKKIANDIFNICNKIIP